MKAILGVQQESVCRPEGRAGTGRGRSMAERERERGKGDGRGVLI